MQLFRKNTFWELVPGKMNMVILELRSDMFKYVYFLILSNFFQNGSPGQTTMLTASASKFCVEPRSPFSNISHHDSNTSGKPVNMKSWPVCRPEFPDDTDGGGDDTLRTLPPGLSPILQHSGMKYPGSAMPHFDYL